MADPTGISAQRPTQLGWPAWRAIIHRAAGQVGADHLSMISAGVAFRFFLALFPAIAAAVSIYGLVADPGDVQRAMESARGILPSQVVDVVGQQMSKIAASSGSALGVGAIVGILLALWSANSGTKSLIEALDIAYNENEKRGFLRLNGLSLLLTVGAIVGLVIAVALVVVLPALLGRLPLPSFVQVLVAWSRWPLLALAMIVALAVFYRYAPSRDEARWQWVSPGAVAATVMWLIASGLFSFYVSHSGSYNETYGSLAAIVILLMWFYLSIFVVLFGAELNSEMERQTARDTTEGEPAPLGQRAAYSADTVAAGESGERRPAVGFQQRGWHAAEAETDAAIEATRRRMAETLHAIRERVAPEAAVTATVSDLRRQVHALGEGESGWRVRPLLIGALGMAAGALLAAGLPQRQETRGSSETLH